MEAPKRIFVTGDEKRLAEFRQRAGADIQADYFLSGSDEPEEAGLETYDAVFDLNLDDFPEKLSRYAHLEGMPVIVSAVKVQLAEMTFYAGARVACLLAGINALPSFLRRKEAEVSVYRKEEEPAITAFFESLHWPAHIVEDRVGMVAPRIVAMIINEAYYTMQEGTAAAADIDASMKLGTNYPMGPFQWCEEIGIGEVYETLDALYMDTRDERYKICPLLKTEYLRREVNDQ